jgi:hypothetical protein
VGGDVGSITRITQPQHTRRWLGRSVCRSTANPQSMFEESSSTRGRGDLETCDLHILTRPVHLHRTCRTIVPLLRVPWCDSFARQHSLMSILFTWEPGWLSRFSGGLRAGWSSGVSWECKIIGHRCLSSRPALWPHPTSKIWASGDLSLGTKWQVHEDNYTSA